MLNVMSFYAGDRIQVASKVANGADHDQERHHAHKEIGGHGKHRPRFFYAAHVNQRDQNDQAHRQRHAVFAQRREQRCHLLNAR